MSNLLSILTFLTAFNTIVFAINLKPATEQSPIKWDRKGFDAAFYNYGYFSTFAYYSDDFFLEDYKTDLVAIQKGVTNVSFDIDDENMYNDVYGQNISTSNFTLELTGYFYANQTGNYTFTLKANKGASFQFGRNKKWCGNFQPDVVDQDYETASNRKPPVIHTVELKQGQYYPIRITYFNSYGDALLNLSYTSPDSVGHTTFDNVFQVDANHCSEIFSPLASIKSVDSSTISSFVISGSTRFSKSATVLVTDHASSLSGTSKSTPHSTASPSFVSKSSSTTSDSSVSKLTAHNNASSVSMSSGSSSVSISSSMIASGAGNLATANDSSRSAKLSSSKVISASKLIAHNNVSSVLVSGGPSIVIVSRSMNTSGAGQPASATYVSSDKQSGTTSDLKLCSVLTLGDESAKKSSGSATAAIGFDSSSTFDLSVSTATSSTITPASGSAMVSLCTLTSISSHGDLAYSTIPSGIHASSSMSEFVSIPFRIEDETTFASSGLVKPMSSSSRQPFNSTLPSLPKNMAVSSNNLVCGIIAIGLLVAFI